MYKWKVTVKQPRSVDWITMDSWEEVESRETTEYLRRFDTIAVRIVLRTFS